MFRNYSEARRKHPVMLCEPVEGAQWRFWCPYCVRWHYHGAGPGHRTAHCFGLGDLDPWPAGYVLRLDPRYRAKRSKRD